MRRLVTDPRAPDPEVIAAAAGLLRGGGLVAFPTETVYGLGVDPFQPAAVERLFVAKGRPEEKGLIFHLGEITEVEELAAEVPAAARALLARFFPGPLTLVLPARERVPLAARGGRSTLAVRMPDHPVALALARAFGGPIAAPSANLSGAPPPRTAEEVALALGDRIDALVDAGPTPGGVPSTLVDLSVVRPRILREGAIASERILQVLSDAG
jgi:L-threonylcarbamoyladenylate synthase